MQRKQRFRAVLIVISLVAFAVAAPAQAAAQVQAAQTPSPMAKKILGPQGPTQASAPAPIKAGKRKTLASLAVLHAKGSVVGLRAGTLILSDGKKIVDIALGPGTVVKTAQGKIVALSSLKKGQRVRVAYRPKGARASAASIDLIS